MTDDEAAVRDAVAQPDPSLIFPLDRNEFKDIPPLRMEVVHQGWLRTRIEYVSLEELQRRRREALAKPGLIQRLAAFLRPARS